MFSFPPLNTSDIPAISGILIAAVALCFYLLLFSNQQLRLLFQKIWPGTGGEIRYGLSVQYAGAFILGLIPVIVFFLINPQQSFNTIGLTPINTYASLTARYSILFGLASFGVSWFAARRPATHGCFPIAGVSSWNTNLLLKYALSWVIYLFAYELLFRGLLFLTLASTYGFWLAAAITTMLYATTHLNKGPDQTIGAFIYGPLLCLITYHTGSIYAAWIIHCGLSLGNGFGTIYYNPDITVSSFNKTGSSVSSSLTKTVSS